MAYAATYQEFALVYAGKVAYLRPTLRCAIRMEAMHGGFPNLIKKLEEFDTATVAALISNSAPRQEAEAFLTASKNTPVQPLMLATQAQLFRLIGALLPSDPDTSTDTPQAAQKAVPWSTVYSDLFGLATGWLGWNPEQAWQATPQEITQAFIAHTTKLKAMHGGDDIEQSDISDEQRQANIEAGLDPEFDRQGLQSLSGLGSVHQ